MAYRGKVFAVMSEQMTALPVVAKNKATACSWAAFTAHAPFLLVKGRRAGAVPWPGGCIRT